MTGLVFALVFTTLGLIGVSFGWRRCTKRYDQSMQEYQDLVESKKEAEGLMVDEADRLAATVEAALNRLQQHRPSV